MRHALAIAMVFGLAACERAPAGKRVTIEWPDPQVGDRAEATKELTNEDSFRRSDGRAIVASSHLSETRRWEVLEVADGEMTKVKVVYPTSERTATKAGKPVEWDGVVPGKSYVVWGERGELKATDGQGAALSAAEVKALAVDWSGLVARSKTRRLFEERSWKVGESVPIGADLLDDLTMFGEQLVVQSATAVLTSYDGNVGTFDLDVTYARTESSRPLTASMHATITLDQAAGRRTEVATASITGEIPNAHVTGTMRVRRTQTRVSSPSRRD